MDQEVEIGELDAVAVNGSASVVGGGGQSLEVTLTEEPGATVLAVSAIHILSVRGAALVTGTLRSGEVAPGDDLQREDGNPIRVLGIEFHAPKGSVTIVVSVDAGQSLHVGDTLTSDLPALRRSHWIV
jgi:hypothetical protein